MLLIGGQDAKKCSGYGGKRMRKMVYDDIFIGKLSQQFMNDIKWFHSWNCMFCNHNEDWGKRSCYDPFKKEA